MSACPRWRWGDSPAPLMQLLERGGVLAIPTESSYGLAVDPTDPKAVASIRRIKGRAATQPLPLVVADHAQARCLGADLTAPIVASLAALWPAPLTLVVPLFRPLAAAGGSDSVAVRIPDHSGLLDLLRCFGSGLTATSANTSGGVPLTDPGEVAHWLAGEDAAVIDDGRLRGGAPSTMVAVHGKTFRILRRGRFPVEILAECVSGLPESTGFRGE